MYNNYDPYYATRQIMNNRQYVKSYLGKPLTLCIPIVIIAIAVISGFLSVVMMAVGFNEFIAQANAMFSQEFALGEDFTISMGSPVGGVSILLCVAMFIIYAKSKNSSVDSMPNGGVTTLWVWSIIKLVEAVFASLVLLVVPFVFTGAMIIGMNVASQELYGTAGDVGISSAAIVLAMVIMVAVMAVCIFFTLFVSINRFRFVSSIRNSITTDKLSQKGAVPFGVINLVAAIGGFAMYLIMAGFFVFFDKNFIETGAMDNVGMGMFFGESFMTMMMLSLAVGLFSLAEPLLMGIFALGYNKHIKSAPGGVAPAVCGFEPVAAPAPAPASANPYAPVAESAVTEDSAAEPVAETPAEETPVAEPVAETPAEETPVAELPAEDAE